MSDHPRIVPPGCEAKAVYALRHDDVTYGSAVVVGPPNGPPTSCVFTHLKVDDQGVAILDEDDVPIAHPPLPPEQRPAWRQITEAGDPAEAARSVTFRPTHPDGQPAAVCLPGLKLDGTQLVDASRVVALATRWVTIAARAKGYRVTRRGVVLRLVGVEGPPALEAPDGFVVEPGFPPGWAVEPQ